MPASAVTNESIDIIRTLTSDVWNGRDYDRLSEFQTKDYVQHGPFNGMELHGSDEVADSIRMYHEAFSDLEMTEEIVFSDESGEYVCGLWTGRGTNDGELMGIPATDQEVEITSLGIYHVEDGHVTEGWVLADIIDLFQQLGIEPDMETLAA